MSTTQTKLLSSATVLSTLSDNDKIVAVTEAGATGLVSKGTLKQSIAPEIRQANGDSAQGKWIRIAEAPSPTTCGIVFIQSCHWNYTQKGSIIAVATNYGSTNPSVVPIIAGTIQKMRLVMLEHSDNSPVAVDVFIPDGIVYTTLRVSCCGQLYAIPQIVDPSIEGTRYAIEFNVGGVETT